MPETSRNIYKQLNLVQQKINPEYLQILNQLVLFTNFGFIFRQPVIQRYLKDGHKIGKPSPLFTKIEQTRLDELKAKYGGQQQSADKPTAAEPSVLKTAEDVEKAIAVQGEKVRVLKTSGAEKAFWQPEVEILLRLKKQLAVFGSSPAVAVTADSDAAAVGKKNKKKK